MSKTISASDLQTLTETQVMIRAYREMRGGVTTTDVHLIAELQYLDGQRILWANFILKEQSSREHPTGYIIRAFDNVEAILPELGKVGEHPWLFPVAAHAESSISGAEKNPGAGSPWVMNSLYYILGLMENPQHYRLQGAPGFTLRDRVRGFIREQERQWRETKRKLEEIQRML